MVTDSVAIEEVRAHILPVTRTHMHLRAAWVATWGHGCGCRRNHVVLKARLAWHELVLGNLGACRLVKKMWFLRAALLLDDLVEDDAGRAGIGRDLDQLLVEILLLLVVDV